MSIPETLKNAIENETLQFKGHHLTEATKKLSERYRDENTRSQALSKKQHLIENELQRAAYILARMPATFQAVKRVLKEITNRTDESFYSILDVGSGPGTAMWAVDDTLYDARNIILLEQDPNLISLGKRLSSECSSPLIRQAIWQQVDVTKQQSFPKSDLVIVSYSLGEWSSEERLKVVEKLWEATNRILVLIEPGTMNGFHVIKEARQHLLDQQAHMVAPCPHALNCPMPANDWCHFSVRVERSKQHKQAKSATLGYEDEKFSYIALAKESISSLPQARVLRHPMKHTGHISFTLCTSDNGIQKKILSKKEGPLYKMAKEMEWGDAFQDLP